jgi:hypothetical protein
MTGRQLERVVALSAIDPSRSGREVPDQSLRPGEYFAVAIAYVEEGMWNAAEYLDSIRRSSDRIAIGDSDARMFALKLINPSFAALTPADSRLHLPYPALHAVTR